MTLTSIPPELWIGATAAASFTVYVAALVLRLRMQLWRRVPELVNGFWTTAYALMVVHVILAFHFAHHWSHRAAYEDTARQTARQFGLDWGGGIYANYALLVLWAVEVVQWWRGTYSKFIQAFLAFMWFNGIVVFGHGWVRWLGVVGFLVLAMAWWRGRDITRGSRGSGG